MRMLPKPLAGHGETVVPGRGLKRLSPLIIYSEVCMEYLSDAMHRPVLGTQWEQELVVPACLVWETAHLAQRTRVCEHLQGSR